MLWSPAFNGCSGLKEIRFPDKIRTIGNSAFRGCSGLKELALPLQLRTIGEYAFSACTGLETVVIPNGTTAIRSHAFEDDEFLMNAVIPASVSKMGVRVFYHCPLDIVVWVEKGSYAEQWCEGEAFTPTYWDGSRPEE